MSIFTPFIRAFNWLTKNAVSHTKDAAKFAVTITEFAKALLASPEANFLENLADTVTGTQLPTNIANAVNNAIPKILTVELAIQGLPDNPTQDDIVAFEQRILAAFNVTADNSKLYTVLGAQVYGIINELANNPKASFANYVDAIEQAYLDYKADLAANAKPVVQAPTPNPQ